MKKFLRAILYFFYTLLIIFVLSEVLVRIWGYSDMYLYDPIYMPFAKSNEIPYVMKPNLKHARAHGNIWINTDSLGLRSSVPGRIYGKKKPDEYRIAIAGDSVTFGVGVPKTHETYPEIVQTTLNHLQRHCQVTVFNFGVSSYSVKEMAATLKYRIPEVDPNLVIMAAVIDDFDTNRTPKIDKFGYTTHGGASELINNFPRIKYFLRRLRLSYLIRDIITRTIMHKEINFNPANGKLPPIVTKSYKYVVQFKKIAQKFGYNYVVVLLPAAEGNGSEFTEIIKKLKHDKINYFNVSYLTTEFTYDQFHASRYDWHPSALVHKKIGLLLSQYIFDHYLKNGCNHKLNVSTSH
jgi:lysophospholipase L1-like esterase